nr:hypothetical protein [Tanacetum cinerariifolium]
MDIMAENVIAVGSENRPLMLENGMYDCWKTQIMLYIQGKENEEMLIDSIKNETFKSEEEITVKDTDEVTLEENNDCDDLQLHTPANFKADHVDAYDSDCNDQATVSAIFMASLSPARSLNDDIVGLIYDSNTLSEVPHYDTYHDDDVDVLNSVVQ